MTHCWLLSNDCAGPNRCWCGCHKCYGDKEEMTAEQKSAEALADSRKESRKETDR